jgi:YHS domain-containing protein
VLRPGKAPGTFVFEATLADGTSRTFAGAAAAAGDGKPLVLTADAKEPAGGVHRVSFTALHGTRLLVLLQAEDPNRHTFSRLGEVGYTREGVIFAAGESYPLCIVTEGRGTIQVSYKGKTYWVCCSGCRDLFNDDPESVLAEAAAREKAAAKK